MSLNKGKVLNWINNKIKEYNILHEEEKDSALEFGNSYAGEVYVLTEFLILLEKGGFD